jgi:ribonuclease HI
MTTFTIVTDGACRGNPGPGGWAALIIGAGKTVELGGHEPHTTNNRMELRAAIEGLRHVPAAAQVRIVTDSSYVAEGAQRWIQGWRRRGWQTLEGKPVENRELWEQLDALAGDRVSWELVRGHAGHPQNERANAIAQRYAGSAPAGRRPSGRPGAFYLSLVDGVLERHASWAECEKRVHRVSGTRYKKVASEQEARATVQSWGLGVDALEALDA